MLYHHLLMSLTIIIGIFEILVNIILLKHSFLLSPDWLWPMSKVRRGSCEEIPHVQGKRNPSKTVGVARGHQRPDRLKPQSRKLPNLTSWTTALSYSMKLSHAMWGHPRRMGRGGEVWQEVVHQRREWQTTSVSLSWEPHEEYEKAKW